MKGQVTRRWAELKGGGREQGQQEGWADRPCEERRAEGSDVGRGLSLEAEGLGDRRRAEGFKERRPRIMREGPRG